MSARRLQIEDLELFAVRADYKPCKMSEYCGLTLRQMERRFQREFGLTPSAWIRKFRCALALKLIAQGYKNKAVVNELKFGNDAQLCHDFRRVYGAPPQSFAPPHNLSGQVRRESEGTAPRAISYRH